MDNKKESDYELNRAGFSATVGLGIIALVYATKDFSNWAATGLLALLGVVFWRAALIHYSRHFKLRGEKGNIKDVGKFF